MGLITKMRISKRQLKRIIKEEKTKIQEVQYSGTTLDDAVANLINELEAIDPDDMRAEIYDIIDQLEDIASRG